MRFEKSLDPENTVRGLARAAALLEQVCPGIKLVDGLADNRAARSEPAPIDLPVQFVVRRLGKELSDQHIRSILEALGFGVESIHTGLLRVAVPSWRATKDISIKDDLVEEVGRLVGYGEITPTAPLLPAVVPPENPMRQYLRRVRAGLTAQGFTEVYNYSFVNETQVRRFGTDVADHLAVANPIASELTHMRRVSCLVYSIPFRTTRATCGISDYSRLAAKFTPMPPSHSPGNHPCRCGHLRFTCG